MTTSPELRHARASGKADREAGLDAVPGYRCARGRLRRLHPDLERTAKPGSVPLKCARSCSRAQRDPQPRRLVAATARRHRRGTPSPRRSAARARVLGQYGQGRHHRPASCRERHRVASANSSVHTMDRAPAARSPVRPPTGRHLQRRHARCPLPASDSSAPSPWHTLPVKSEHDRPNQEKEPTCCAAADANP